MECYTKGTVDCYDKGSVNNAFDNIKNELSNFLITHDCYEKGTVYCYNEQRPLYNCDAGYSLACVPN